MDVSPAQQEFGNDEAAARFYIERIFSRGRAPVLRSLAASGESQLMSALRYLKDQSRVQLPKNHRMAKFVEVCNGIPLFGSNIVVELDQDRKFISANGRVDQLPEISLTPGLNWSAALERISASTRHTMSGPAAVSPAELNLYKDDRQAWHLVHFFRRVPAVPKEADSMFHNADGHGLAPSPRSLEPRFDYLVDAHTGEILFYYSSDPTLAAPQTAPIPVKCRAEGEDQEILEFWVINDQTGVGPPVLKMIDPLRKIATCDRGFADLTTTPPPSEPVSQKGGTWSASDRPAISAHAKVARVLDFYSSVLQRHSIARPLSDRDDPNPLMAVVNCTYCKTSSSRQEWRNAVWYNDRIWFGQEQQGNGAIRSYSRFLDIIAHELTHGLTQNTCDLVYRDQSGALDESICDIFAVIIKNLDSLGDDTPVSEWNWEIGSGLGANGDPLRDLSDPKATGNPDHMSNYVVTAGDSGGVHANSNIHNKAAYNLLSTLDSSGRGSMFDPTDVALLYYLSITRIGRLADFAAMRDAIALVTQTYYIGDPNGVAEKVAAVHEAYARAGITGNAS